jgi:translation elongation factor EF-Ts
VKPFIELKNISKVYHTKAETWLNSQAQAQGWAKAAKLQSRSTPNGLVGIMLDTKCAVMVCNNTILF